MAWMHLFRCVPASKNVCKVPVNLFAFQRPSSHAAVIKPGEVGIEDQHHAHKYVPEYHADIGAREVVGFGFAGEPKYADSCVWPYPAIRFREADANYKVLQEKEKGDWKKMTVEEKKELYRLSFCETFAEMSAPHGHWRSVMGIYFFWISLAFWGMIFLRTIFPPLPDSFSDEARLAQLKRMIDIRVGAVDGLASKWDYEKGRWKE